MDGTENLWSGKEWFMAYIVSTIVLGVIACAIWDGIKAVWRLMR